MSELDKTIHYFFVHVIFQYSQFVISSYLVECDLEGNINIMNCYSTMCNTAQF